MNEIINKVLSLDINDSEKVSLIKGIVELSEKLNPDHFATKDELEELRDSISNLESDLDDLRNDMENFDKDQINDLERKVDDIESKISDLEYLDIEENIGKLEEKDEELGKKIIELKEVLSKQDILVEKLDESNVEVNFDSDDSF